MAAGPRVSSGDQDNGRHGMRTYNSDGTVNETFDSDDLSDLAIYPGGIIVRRTRGTFPAGYRNCYLTYTHGWTAVPADIKWAGLIASLQELTFSNISERATGLATVP